MSSLPTLASVILDYVRNCEQLNFAMYLSEKLKIIRNHLGLTQDQMAGELGLTSESRRSRISEWEAGRGEPKRDILIRYSELANIDVKKLVDDREVMDF